MIVFENVPTKIKSIPMPSAKVNRVKNPTRGLPRLATTPRSSAMAGVRQGEAAVPDIAPNKKLYKIEPFTFIAEPCLINFGI